MAQEHFYQKCTRILPHSFPQAPHIFSFLLILFKTILTHPNGKRQIKFTLKYKPILGLWEEKGQENNPHYNIWLLF